MFLFFPLHIICSFRKSLDGHVEHKEVHAATQQELCYAIPHQVVFTHLFCYANSYETDLGRNTVKML